MFQLLIVKIVKEPSPLKILLNAFAHLCVACEKNLPIGILMFLVRMS